MGSSEKDVWGWIASNEADLAANYANRGRSYRDLSNDELTARSIASFREIAADLRNYKARAVTADLKSEFDLRAVRSDEIWCIIAFFPTALINVELNDQVGF